MFKLVFIFVVLAVVVITANPHPRQTQSKKASALQKHSAHHGLDLHGRPVTRVARSHAAHGPVHHAPGGSVHHSNKVGGSHSVRSVHGGNHAAHGSNKGVVHRPVKQHRGHRK